MKTTEQKIKGQTVQVVRGQFYTNIRWNGEVIGRSKTTKQAIVNATQYLVVVKGL